MSSRDHYAVLGVRRTATANEIRDAFRGIAWRCHPDRDPGSEAHDRFIEAAAAFEVLSKPQRRARYDEQRMVPVPPAPGERGPARPRHSGQPRPGWMRSAFLVGSVSSLPVLVGFAEVLNYRYALYALAVLFALALTRLSREL